MASVNLTTHVSGLASGMDTETIVNNMMKVNRIPLDKILQAKTINSWKTDAYREINTKIASFRDAMQDLRLEGTFSSAQKISSSDTRVDVSLSGKTSQTNFTITEAKMAVPAKAAMVSFNSQISSGSATIFSDGVEPVDMTFTVNGKEIKISKESTTFDKAIAEINTQLAEKNIKLSNVGGSLVFTTLGTGKGNSITISGADSNVQTTDADSNPINVNVLTKLGISNGTTSSGFGEGISFTDGEDLKSGYVVINGTTINVTSNSFTYDNIQINLKQDFSGGHANIQVTPDTDKVFDKIKTFVDKYNELIKDLNDKISEKKYRDYLPLTDDQKKDMKDNDIKLWEDKAKSGLLANDSTISQFLTQMRTSITEMVNGVGISLKDIGITTSTDYKENGKLVLDEDKLKSMLTTNLTDIQKLFAGKYDTGNYKDNTLNNQTKYKNSGIAVRVYDRIGDALNSLKVIAGYSTDSSLVKEAAEYDKRIASLQDRLSRTEQNLWAKFNAMEQALQKLNSQSSWLYQQLGQ
ncbi:flagellar filament capping protein FliD [Neobacillus sp. OS1-32]|uniref:Flagellar hook-associated protein 2 n=1 Tax=Neobacillus paridis TaxID=2803862 RepID=A0ABS1TNS8_9BACI|nr:MULTISPECIES: flagellar filament capping protein FliD [Neobacillus]MBL4952927.1 flagellar filament capping protein FliD [Neobacillus paridis]WML31553.1 flagellar filament capping protein FliD [Neobacillus sp. OS1-32]